MSYKEQKLNKLNILLDHAVPQVVFEGAGSLKKTINKFLSQIITELEQDKEKALREIEQLKMELLEYKSNLR